MFARYLWRAALPLAYSSLAFAQPVDDAVVVTASRTEQIRVAENVLRSQGLGAWPKCGAQAGSPAVWANPTMPTAPTMTTGCAAMPSTGLFGFINPRQMCSALLHPLGTLGA